MDDFIRVGIHDDEYRGILWIAGTFGAGLGSGGRRDRRFHSRRSCSPGGKKFRTGSRDGPGPGHSQDGWTPPCRTFSFLRPRRSSKGWAQRRTRREKEAHKGGDNVGSLTHRLGQTRNKAAVGRAVVLEPFLRHIFSVFDNSRQISTSAVRDHSVWNPEIAVTDLAGGCLCSFPCTQPVRDGSIWRQGISRRYRPRQTTGIADEVG